MNNDFCFDVYPYALAIHFATLIAVTIDENDALFFSNDPKEEEPSFNNFIAGQEDSAPYDDVVSSSSGGSSGTSSDSSSSSIINFHLINSIFLTLLVTLTPHESDVLRVITHSITSMK